MSWTVNRRHRVLLLFVLASILAGCTHTRGSQPPDHLTLQWSDNLLTIASPTLPEGPIEILYLEAFCRTGSTYRRWEHTVIPNTTRLMAAAANGRRLRLQSAVEPGVIVDHEIRASRDTVDFRLLIRNTTNQHVDIEWAQPCVRVGEFTGLDQDHYHQRCFIVTERGVESLAHLPRAEDAVYRGGQVYVPPDINPADVNPRPISRVIPKENIIGCWSADNSRLLAIAWDSTQELFQGVVRCIHSDFRIGGLEPHETKRIYGKLYLIENNVDTLVRRYRRDFWR